MNMRRLVVICATLLPFIAHGTEDATIDTPSTVTVDGYTFHVGDRTRLSYKQPAESSPKTCIHIDVSPEQTRRRLLSSFTIEHHSPHTKSTYTLDEAHNTLLLSNDHSALPGPLTDIERVALQQAHENALHTYATRTALLRDAFGERRIPNKPCVHAAFFIQPHHENNPSTLIVVDGLTHVDRYSCTLITHRSESTGCSLCPVS
ncbi:hypothetical protein JST99_05085 [Candidatus Dependentiae bacterium]|nr:hypothetical protein [Candidatus Dependentiae bacterium]MCC7415290.1 hypothetical protein [Campylobacterota bacterium]